MIRIIFSPDLAGHNEHDVLNMAGPDAAFAQ